MHRINNQDLIYPQLSYFLNGLLFKVHNQLGRFRNERQYADAVEEVLQISDIKYQREKSLPVSFKGEQNRRNIPDFLIEDKIILDIKAKRLITKEDYFQMRRYLVSYNRKLGIIVNFRQSSINPKRVLNSFFKS